MAKQKRYGARPRNEPIFRLSPLLISSPVRQVQQPTSRLASSPEDVQVQNHASPARVKRDALVQISANDQSPSQRTRSKVKDRPCADVDQLADLVSELAVDSSPKKTQTRGCRTRISRKVNIPLLPDPYTAPLLALGLEPSDRPCAFSTWSASIEAHFDIVKIAEASYGEVYRLVTRSPDAKSTLDTSEESVLKVLALKPPPIPQGPSSKAKSRSKIQKESLMSAVDNVAAEVKLLQRMADIPGFTNFRDVRVLQGKPSQAFARAWSQFNDARPDDDKSQFPDPSKRGSYAKEQLWAVIEMQDAGLDLEHVRLADVFSVWDVFWGVALALAKGEQEAEFEHRDLHLGNICVKAIERNAGCAVEHVKFADLSRKYGFTGLETTIIDYTLSRADTGGQIDFLDLATEEAIFEGNANDHYQYELYRYMRAAMYFDDPLAAYSARKASLTDRQWAQFHPQTNLLWLHFILHEMLASCDFAWPSSSDTYLQRVSAECHKAAQTKARRLEVQLKKLEVLLQVQKMPQATLQSASDLIGWALRKGWLDEIDVVGDGDSTLSSLLA